MSHFRKAAGDKIFDSLQKSLEDMLPSINTVPSDKRDLMHSIFFPQAYAQLGSHIYQGLCPHGVAEVRMITDGGCIIGGVDKQHIKGETLQDSHGFDFGFDIKHYGFDDLIDRLFDLI